MSGLPNGTLLALDAATYGGTVAVLRDGRVIASSAVAMRGEREERLMPAVVETLTAADVAAPALAGVVCGAGPGSFTSLRIAASIAKGIAHAAGVPLYAVPSLALMVPADGRYLATLDAIRGDAYAALIDVVDGVVTAYDYLGIVPAPQRVGLATDHGARLIVPTDADADSVGGAVRPIVAPPHAERTVALGALIAAAGRVDLDAWEPDYGRKAEAQVKWEAAHGRPLPIVDGVAG